ncbi:MAG: DUF308 domain-containing protein [Methanobacteriaceae archaeon]|nr:DUF308 domain-containing protein [Methanobacteriaceae archaeon]
MKKITTSIIAIILGLIIIVGPAIKIIPSTQLLGLSVLLLSIYLLIEGIGEIEYNTTKGLLNVILGLIILIVSIGLIFNPGLFSFLTALTIYLAGIFLIIIGLIIIIGNRDNKYKFWSGILGIVLGVVYIILGTYIKNPIILGSLIGVWLLITGVLNIFNKN